MKNKLNHNWGLTNLFSILAFLMLSSFLLTACHKSYDEKKQEEKASRAELEREDSLALKIATVPTLDCLHLFIGVEDSLFMRNGLDVQDRKSVV